MKWDIGDILIDGVLITCPIRKPNALLPLTCVQWESSTLLGERMTKHPCCSAIDPFWIDGLQDKLSVKIVGFIYQNGALLNLRPVKNTSLR